MRVLATQRVLLTAGITLWLSIVGLGFERVWRYAVTPGPAATATADWPSTTFAHDALRPTLVMFLHPECACSQASLEELSRLVAKTRSQVSVLVVIGSPDIAQAPAPDNVLWHAASAMTGVTPMFDRGGREAASFGAHVSGQTFLYDRTGRLVFSGGITSSRGQAGDNDGETALLALITNAGSPITRTSVFGCLLEGRLPS